MRFYTYQEIAKIFKVKPSTVKFWKAKGKIEIYGYRPYIDSSGKRLREAIVEEKEVERLCVAIFKRGSWYMGNQDKRLLRYKVVDEVVKDKSVDESVDVINESVDGLKVNNQSYVQIDRDNAYIEGDDVIVNSEDNMSSEYNSLISKEL